MNSTNFAPQFSSGPFRAVNIPAKSKPRLAPRPFELRQEGYEEKFDASTLLYDVIVDREAGETLLVGPPALNLRSLWETARLEDYSGTALELSSEYLDRLFRAKSKLPNPNSEMGLRFDGHLIRLRSGRVDRETFRDQNVLLTLSRNNSLQWIYDWAQFHVRFHGVTAVFFFDNESDTYSLDDLKGTLMSVPGLQLSKVVSWPFKHGPTAFPSSGLWDSDFGKHGFFETARHRYLTRANWVLNLDIDELLVSPTRKRLSDFMAANRPDYLEIQGHWAFPLAFKPGLPKHSDCRYVDREKPMHQKWVVSPQLATPATQWKTHRITGLNQTNQSGSDFELRHFWPISTSWKYDRSNALPTIAGLARDHTLDSYFEDL